MFNLPVTVVAGYLGSGKTTYINKKLAQANGLRYAVLVNDFGKLNIDAELIESETTKSISLVNGCVCCSIANDVDGALEEIRSMADLLDWVILEASGVADPGRVRNMVLNWPGFEMKESITLVDATRVQRLVNDKFVGQHIRAQLADSGRLLLSKVDLLPEGEVEKIERWLEQFMDHQQSSSVSQTSQFHETHPEYYTESFVCAEPVSRERLEAWLRGLDESVIRVKGFLLFNDDVEHQYLLQWVGGDWRIERRGRWRQTRETKLVLISSRPTSVLTREFKL